MHAYVADTLNLLSIHLDLRAASLIPDPFIGQNEADLQWIQHRTWVYTTNFASSPVSENEHADLVFEGLDTFATVTLNGHEVLKTDNMFIGHRVNVKALLQPENELEITFDSAYDKGEALRAEHGHRVCWNGHYGRIYVRKAQYHFGWDWGPSFVTCGPWKPVSLERYTSRISEVLANYDLPNDWSYGHMKILVRVEHKTESQSVHVELTGPDGVVVASHESEYGTATLFVAHPQLWFPHTHGQQPLYQLKATLRSSSGEVLDSKTQNVGFRRIELVQEPLGEGKSFYFKVNGVPIFMGGSNWIPGDAFLPRMTPARYRRWVELAVQGNQNMLRVWGGGIYEDDAFYDECDKRGVLVWQDFLFACGQYPSDKWFIDSVKEEAVQNIKRLRSHPSLAIWAGNNEDYQVANEGLKHDMEMPISEWLDSTFPARITYENILPSLVERHSPGTLYWPGSPFGGVDNNSDRTIGDVHIWNVSSGMLLPYQRYPDVPARFISEFGMISCPSVATVKETFFGDDDEDHHPQSKAFEFHNKAHGYEKRMFTCIGESVRMSFELEQYIYLSQLVQAEAMYYAYRGWRRLFEGRQCGGTLVWQLNDVWPVTSWAIVDHYERPKLAYYSIARAMRSVTTGISRKLTVNPRPNHQHEAFCDGKTKADAAGVIAHATPHIYPKRGSTFSVWVVNATNRVQILTVRVRFISIESGKAVRDTFEQVIDAKAAGTTDILSGEGPEEEPTVIVSEIFNTAGNLVSHDVDWPQPLKHLTFPDRQVRVQVHGEHLIVSAARPVKGLFFSNIGVGFSDNGMDVVPGQNLTIAAKGLKEEPQWIYYGL